MGMLFAVLKINLLTGRLGIPVLLVFEITSIQNSFPDSRLVSSNSLSVGRVVSVVGGGGVGFITVFIQEYGNVGDIVTGRDRVPRKLNPNPLFLTFQICDP